jgi:hypothetical protein
VDVSAAGTSGVEPTGHGDRLVNGLALAYRVRTGWSLRLLG